MADVGIDYGKVRTGFAMCVSGIVIPLEPLVRTTWTAIAGRLDVIFSEHSPGTVVIGLPVSASGKATLLSKEVEKLTGWLAGKGYTVKLVSEVCSTAEARELRTDLRRDGRIDSVAAAILLKRYLNLP